MSFTSYNDAPHDHIPTSLPCPICGEGTATKYKEDDLLDDTVVLAHIGYTCDHCGADFANHAASIWNCTAAVAARAVMEKHIVGFLPLFIRRSVYNRSLKAMRWN